MRSSARSAVSIDARDSLQPVDHAGRAAMAREGMLQSCRGILAKRGMHAARDPDNPGRPHNPPGHTAAASIGLLPTAAPSNPLRLTAAAARGPHPNRNPRVAREWGSNPHPTPHPPPSTRAHPACRPGLETVGRGEGGSHQAPGCGQRERDLPIPHPGRHNPPCI